MLFSLPHNLVAHKVLRKFGGARMPLSYTFAVTWHCNSRCKTCNIWRIPPQEELTLEEYEKISKNLGGAYWVTISGGEPFLRPDLLDIILTLYNNIKPAVINIPTNGSVNVLPVLKKLLQNTKAIIILNFSLDAVGERHDQIRGAKNSYTFLMHTLHKLKKIKSRRFLLGVHTTISKYNLSFLEEVFSDVSLISPDSHIFEIAQKRREFRNLNGNFEISKAEKEKILGELIERLQDKNYKGISRIIKAFRLEYYKTLRYSLIKKPSLKCYAGYSSCYITPTGEVWACSVNGAKIGDLRTKHYNFKRIWFSESARNVRREVGDCYCPIANIHYLNLLFDTKSVLKVIMNTVLQ